ncbi:hypothetical protein GCM10027346_42770 [Hymenobacter seoulensis]
MTRNLPLLTLSLALVATACDKETAAPTLEGRWDYERSETYSARGTLLPQPVPEIRPESHYLVAQGTKVSRYSWASSSIVAPFYTYDPAQNTLLAQDGIISRVEELTAHSLRVRTPTFVASNGPITDPVTRYDVVYYYSR